MSEVDRIVKEMTAEARMRDYENNPPKPRQVPGDPLRLQEGLIPQDAEVRERIYLPPQEQTARLARELLFSIPRIELSLVIAPAPRDFEGRPGMPRGVHDRHYEFGAALRRYGAVPTKKARRQLRLAYRRMMVHPLS
jgi:hypothetical protein